MSFMKPPIICRDDKKAHSKTVADAWAEYDIKVWPGAGQVYDRTLISDFTGEDDEKLGGYPVNSPGPKCEQHLEKFGWWSLRHLQQAETFAANDGWFYE